VKVGGMKEGKRHFNTLSSGCWVPIVRATDNHDRASAIDTQSVRGRSERPYMPDAPIRQKTQYVATWVMPSAANAALFPDQNLSVNLVW
jgi:hypothetical protein